MRDIVAVAWSERVRTFLREAFPFIPFLTTLEIDYHYPDLKIIIYDVSTGFFNEEDYTFNFLPNVVEKEFDIVLIIGEHTGYIGIPADIQKRVRVFSVNNLEDLYNFINNRIQKYKEERFSFLDKISKPKKEKIVKDGSGLYGYELFAGMPRDEDEDLKKALYLLMSSENNSSNNYINILPKTLIKHNEVIGKELQKVDRNIIFEIVEKNSSTELSDLRKVVENLNISISIDDFGTGASNFDRIFYLPNIKSIKVDRIMWERKENKPIIEAIMSVAEKKGIKLIAEKVETKQEYEYLKDIGFEYFQGYFCEGEERYGL